MEFFRCSLGSAALCSDFMVARSIFVKLEVPVAEAKAGQSPWPPVYPAVFRLSACYTSLATWLNSLLLHFQIGDSLCWQAPWQLFLPVSQNSWTKLALFTTQGCWRRINRERQAKLPQFLFCLSQQGCPGKDGGEPRAGQPHTQWYQLRVHFVLHLLRDSSLSWLWPRLGERTRRVAESNPIRNEGVTLNVTVSF